LAACSDPPKKSPEQHNEVHPIEASADGSGRYITFSSPGGSNTLRKLFLFDRKSREMHQLGESAFADFFPVANSKVAYWTNGPRASQFDSVGKLQKEIPFPKGAADSWRSCSGSVRYLVCADDYSGLLNENSPDFNPLGFTAISVLDFEQGKSWQFRVIGSAYYFFFQPRRKRILVSNNLNENEAKTIVTSYDLKGKVLGRFRQRGTSYSPHDEYYVPQLHESALPWEVYDGKTGKMLASFNRSKEIQPGFYEDYGGWNPQHDNLLLISRSYNDPAANGKNRLLVYDVKTGKTISEFSGLKTQPISWNADGTQLIFFINCEFIFEPVLVN
jgi:hypothetical protein